MRYRQAATDAGLEPWRRAPYEPGIRARSPAAVPMLRSLFVLDALPYPPLGGQQLRYRQAIEALLPLGPVTLLLLGEDVPAPAGAPPCLRLAAEVPHDWRYRLGRLLGPRGKRGSGTTPAPSSAWPAGPPRRTSQHQRGVGAPIHIPTPRKF